ncbi:MULTISPECIES: type I-F CRISPR-associated protein Csy1 [unclassified Halomonas]|uniref:type I-F CRISPR-associated protein Csy1 n=1 Tax=unclassified Halomonas TaxID=2609666 RepID=UPI001EF626FF|nr:MULTISPECIES: type I-F CRISPR-associated protein Csy1 [unclassified Halomonas]MCG7576973.1 type I-F CRISPR-associated protein Csy1 [Halomonas sp. MMH1-48]MCG7604036.1 type I-F CRISPR-associated protein Csy1 [Halomonas sp. MM17-34]MCG7613156.1 type I-F CRISPR-associated protein Csy1 [Halomonas sp. MM17-29]MCG7619931.1 type I-F CRISPR-associated protein Csy1 [Halomonas sp. DSH1-27]
MPSNISPNHQVLRKIINDFLEERLALKTEKLAPDDPKYQALVEQFHFDTWINDAARRVGQLQVVTHSLKPIHPDAKGSNLYAPPESLNNHSLVGSHTLSADFAGDVVGNAAALDVYKFLKLQFEGKSLLERVLENDAEMAKALSANPEQAQSWISAFAAITEPRGEHASHTRGKQLYWLVGEDAADLEKDAENFHLLAPLYATSLAHRVFQTINHDRFSEEAKEARKAKREGKYAGQPVHSYPNLAVQKMGGTKPQNISQLNSERGGNNYLLASMPPSWGKQQVSPPYNVDSVFHRFEKLDNVKRDLGRLAWFLSSDPSPNVHTRTRVDDIHGSLIDELMAFTSQFHELPAGWSTSEKCNLPIEEIYWLDPGRSEGDEQFRKERENLDWTAAVRRRFSNWLNEKLSKKLSVGDVEFFYWQKKLKENATHQRVLDRDRRWLASLEKELDAWEGALDDE